MQDNISTERISKATLAWLKVELVKDGHSSIALAERARTLTEQDHLEYHAFCINAFRQAATESVTDSLTGLHNRRYFEERLDEAIQYVERVRHRTGEDKNVALVSMDLVGFKAINETYGHKAGDQVLAHFAQALRDVARQNDVAARLGGDEFWLILNNGNGSPVNVEVAKQRVSKGLDGLVCTLDDGRKISYGVRVGVVDVEQGMSASDIMEQADQKMYEEERQGMCGLYSPHTTVPYITCNGVVVTGHNDLSVFSATPEFN